jgi:protein-S-isoprenylcysteine O-methyltransferase Ste14
MRDKLVLIPPPVYALALLALAQTLTVWAPLPFDLSLDWLGTPLAAAGVGLMLWAWSCFRRSGTTPMPTGTPSSLVLTGPYRWTRNPMYLGITTVLAGLALILGSPWFTLVPVGFWQIVNRLFIPYEEARLTALFGRDFQAFTVTVRRWL